MGVWGSGFSGFGGLGFGSQTLNPAVAVFVSVRATLRDRVCGSALAQPPRRGRPSAEFKVLGLTGFKGLIGFIGFIGLGCRGFGVKGLISALGLRLRGLELMRRKG